MVMVMVAVEVAVVVLVSPAKATNGASETKAAVVASEVKRILVEGMVFAAQPFKGVNAIAWPAT